MLPNLMDVSLANLADGDLRTGDLRGAHWLSSSLAEWRMEARIWRLTVLKLPPSDVSANTGVKAAGGSCEVIGDTLLPLRRWSDRPPLTRTLGALYVSSSIPVTLMTSSYRTPPVSTTSSGL